MTPLFRWATLLVLLLWYLLYWEGGRRAAADIRKAVSRRDALLMLTIAFGSLVVVVGGALLALERISAWIGSPVLALVGFLLTATGIAGTFACRRYLGRFWTAEVALQQEHRIVDRGPYGVVRHPIYAFAILIYLGLGLAFPTWCVDAVVVLIVLAYVLKTAAEDDFLAERLPGYREYRRRVAYRLWPGVW